MTRGHAAHFLVHLQLSQGLTQLWEGSLRGLHHPTVLAHGLTCVHDGVLSGERGVASAALAVAAALACEPHTWAAMSKHGVLRAACHASALSVIVATGSQGNSGVHGDMLSVVLFLLGW